MSGAGQMAFEDATYYHGAVRGEVGSTAYLTQHALKSLADAIEQIAANSGVDVGDRLEAAREDIQALSDEFERLTGWSPQ